MMYHCGSMLAQDFGDRRLNLEIMVGPILKSYMIAQT
jgi:hypothetical protein